MADNLKTLRLELARHAEYFEQKLDNAVMELGFVLKAIEELAVEKGLMTREDIQKKIIELSESGWTPVVVMEDEKNADN